MIRNKSIFSIFIIIVFLFAKNINLREIIPNEYYPKTTILALLPAVIGMLSLFLFHQKKNILSSMGIDKGFFKGLGFAFFCTLPMLIGYATVGEINEEFSFKNIYYMVLLAPLAEELFYRGFLFGQLYRFGGWGFIPAGLLSAFIFGGMHLYQANDWSSAIGVFAMTGMGGMWFAWLYIEWGRNLWVSIFLHLFMNCYWGIFGIAENATGGFYANVFRTATIVLTIVATQHLHKKQKRKAITKDKLWVNKEAEELDTNPIQNIPFAKA